MKQIIDAVTGELIDVEEPNEIAVRRLNELGVNFEDYCEFTIKFKYFKDQIKTWEYEHKQILIDVIKEAFKNEKSKTLKLPSGSITYVKGSISNVSDTDALRGTTVRDFVAKVQANPQMLDMSVFDCFTKLSAKEDSIRIKVNE